MMMDGRPSPESNSGSHEYKVRKICTTPKHSLEYNIKKDVR